MTRNSNKIALCLVLAVSACAPAESGNPAPGTGGSSGMAGRGGSSGRGGSGGATGGSTGGSSSAGTGGSSAGTGGSSATGGTTGGSNTGSGGSAGAGGAGGTGGGAGSSGGTGGGGAGGGVADAGSDSGGGGGMTDGAAGPEMGGMIPPSAPGQGPVAMGRVVFSNDFESNAITGFSRSPNGLPEDRARIIDDPVNQRGKVVQVEWRAGDNFRTSGGTEPRSWFSNRPGHEFRPGAKVSHAFGMMFNQADTNYCFGQIISSGGPVWMLILEGSGVLTVFCNTCGGNTRHMTLEPKKWYDFRVDMDFSGGGAVKFYINGQMFRMGQINSTRGDIAHWDGGIYNRANGTSGNRTRQMFLSNLSVGIRD
jgi:hypothetical protein